MPCRAGIAAMAAAIEGLDVLVFSAGIGERSPRRRHRIGTGGAWLGIGLDPAANERHGLASAHRSRASTYS